MPTAHEPDIERLHAELRAASEDAATFIAAVSEGQAVWRPAPDCWNAAQCLDHLALTNRAYIAALETAATQARSCNRLRRGPARPGWFASKFLKQLEPPVRPGRTLRAPRIIQPREDPSLAEAYADFESSQQLVHDFLDANSDLDLAGILFVNPFIPGLRFSIASGLNIIIAHERRHLWQARRVLRPTGS